MSYDLLSGIRIIELAEVWAGYDDDVRSAAVGRLWDPLGLQWVPPH